MLFSNAGAHLEPYENEQVGLGLHYLVSHAISDVPFAAVDLTVPLQDAMRMMAAMPVLWRECIGPRLAHVHAPIGSIPEGMLNYVCYMWFDIWVTFWQVREQRAWRDTLWQVFEALLAVSCREVCIAALHGNGHHLRNLEANEVQPALNAFVGALADKDPELCAYARAASQGRVQ